MGFFDALLGGKGKLKAPAPDRLFAMSTAYVQLETGLGITSRGTAGLVFQPLGTADFEALMKETEELLRRPAQDTGTTTETKVDEHGYRWAILRDPDFEDIVVAVNTVSSQLELGRLRRPAPVRGVRVRGERQADLLDLQLQARDLLPVRPDREAGSATRSASSG